MTILIHYLGFYIFIINYSEKSEYIKDRSLNQKQALRNHKFNLLAIVAATIVHNYLIQPYIIPTGSLEKSLPLEIFSLLVSFIMVQEFQ